MNTHRIFLCGFMGSGKTTVGEILAKRLGLAFIDTDRAIEEKTKLAVTDIFAKFGEVFFRDEEAVCLKEAIQKNEQAVFALGGGALLRAENQNLVKASGIVIHLSASRDEIMRRISHDKGRPLWNIDKWDELMKARAQGYRIADWSFDTDGLTVETVAESVLQYITKRRGIEKK